MSKLRSPAALRSTPLFLRLQSSSTARWRSRAPLSAASASTSLRCAPRWAIRPRGGSLRNFRARSHRLWPASGAPALRSRCGSTPSILGSSSGGQGPQGTSPDQILGEVIVGGVARPLRASTSYYPMAVDQALVEQSNHDRVSQLVQAFAYWAAREV